MAVIGQLTCVVPLFQPIRAQIVFNPPIADVRISVQLILTAVIGQFTCVVPLFKSIRSQIVFNPPITDVRNNVQLSYPL